MTSIPAFRVQRAVPFRTHTAIAPDSFDDHVTLVGGVTLRDFACPGMRVVIVFTDATRHSPDRLLVGWLLRELSRCGIGAGDVTLLCATGLHRPSTPRERDVKLGPVIASSLAIVDHDAIDRAGLVKMGSIDIDGLGGIPVVVNRLCAEADLLLATGVVEPHQYAGYSGGYKTIVIGCGGEATIQATHGVAMLDRPGTRLGAVEGNPFQSFVREAGRMIGLDYVINVLLDGDGEIIAAAAGAPADVHDHLVARGRDIYEVQVRYPVHVAIAGVSAAKASNLYQASRAATYLGLAAGTPLLPGAPIILPAEIPEGAGEGTGERRFFETLSAAYSPAALVGELQRTGFPAGAQRAYVLAKVLMEHPVIVVGAMRPDVVRACHMQSVPDIDEALVLAERLARGTFAIPPNEQLDLLVVPNALVTLPNISRDGEMNLTS